MTIRTQTRGVSALLLASSVLASSTAAQEPAKTPAELFTSAAPSVMTVLAHNADPALSMIGSAVAIGQDRAVTNCHVIAGASRLQVKYQDQFYLAQREYTDEPRDLCSLIVSGLPATPARIADVGQYQVGDRVYAIGSPQGFELSLSEGLISGFRKQAAGQVIQTTAAISPGSSGGGLFDDAGNLIGITTSKAAEGEAIGFAAPSSWIADLRSRHAPPSMPQRAHSSEAPAVSNAVLDVTYRWPTASSPASPAGIVGDQGRIYAQVTTQTAAPAVLTATVTYGEAQQLVTTVSEVVDAGMQVTTFELSKPTPWPVGGYKLQLSINNKPVQQGRFCVQNARTYCREVQGMVYSYIKDGVRHYTSKYPANPDAVESMRAIRYTYYETMTLP